MEVTEGYITGTSARRQTDTLREAYMLIVKKFGGSSVADKERIFNVARRVSEDFKAGHDVVVEFYRQWVRRQTV